MNYRYNFHSHTDYCDGANKAEEMIKEAIRLGVKSYGVSSHSPVPFANYWSMQQEDLSKYIHEVSELKQKYRDDIEIYCGLETDFIKGLAGASSFKGVNGLDYLFCSVHYLYKNPSEHLFEIDGPFVKFQEGYVRVFNSDPIAITKKFYELTREMIETDPPHVVGHIDKIKMNLEKVVPKLEQLPWYKEELVKLADCLGKHQPIVEVNTRGMYKGYTNEPYPSWEFIRMMKERDVRISLNSDSHQPEEILRMYPKTIKKLKELGYNESWALIGGKWQEVPL